MAKIINKVAQGYQIIPRELVLDSTISDRARFVYCFMASKPDDWDFFLEPMAKEIGYSIDTLRKYIKELVESGWLVKGEQENENGRFGSVYYELMTTKFSDTEIFRHGKTHIQDIIDNKEIIDKHSTNVNKEEKEIDKSISKKRDFGIDLSIVPEPLLEIVIDWLEYKKERRESYKPRGFQSFVKTFVRDCNNDPTIARQMVERAMSNNYAGVFPLKDNNKSSNNLPVGMVITGDRTALYEEDKKNLW